MHVWAFGISEEKYGSNMYPIPNYTINYVMFATKFLKKIHINKKYTLTRTNVH